MVKKYWTYLETKKYNIYLTSRTVYIYDKEGNEIKKFKDLDYAYRGCISNSENLLVIKSSSGRMAVYALDRLELIKKFRFSKVDGSQDDNFIFSLDDKYLLNIERHNSSTKTALSIYDTSDFSLKNRLFTEDENLALNAIEYDNELNCYFILGFYRDVKTRYASKYFIARFIDDKLEDIRFIDEKESHFLLLAKNLDFCGYTEEAYDWLWPFKSYSLEQIKGLKVSLSKVWKKS